MSDFCSSSLSACLMSTPDPSTLASFEMGCTIPASVVTVDWVCQTGRAFCFSRAAFLADSSACSAALFSADEVREISMVAESIFEMPLTAAWRILGTATPTLVGFVYWFRNTSTL